MTVVRCVQVLDNEVDAISHKTVKQVVSKYRQDAIQAIDRSIESIKLLLVHPDVDPNIVSPGSADCLLIEHNGRVHTSMDGMDHMSEKVSFLSWLGMIIVHI